MSGGREGIDQEAAAAGLGRRSGTFVSQRHIAPGVAWALVGGAAVLGIVLAAAQVYAVAAVLVPIALIALATVRYRVTPDGGRRWLMLFEHGMAEVAPPPEGGQRLLRLIRWSEVAGVVPDQARPGSYALTVDGDAPPVRLADLSPAVDLRRGLARHVPDVPWPTGVGRGHGRVVLTALGFAALAVLPALVPIVSPPASRTAATATATASVAGSSPSAAASRSASASPTPSPTVQVLPLPTTTVGFYQVCRGTATFPSAPAFAGPPPHPVYFPVPWFGEESWHADRPADVQLVVCTKRSTEGGAKVRSCTYQTSDGPFTQDLIKTTWTITLVEARTGRTVAQHTVVGGTTKCLPGLLPDYDVYPPALTKTQETSLTDRQAYDTVGRYVLR